MRELESSRRSRDESQITGARTALRTILRGRPARRRGPGRLQPRALHPRPRRRRASRSSGRRAAWSPRSNRSCAPAPAPGSRTAAARPTARWSTGATASRVPPDNPRLPHPARLAHRRGGGRLLLRLRQRGAVAALPHRPRAAGLPRRGLGAVRAGQPPLRRAWWSTRRAPRPDRAGAGLSLRAAAAHDPRAAARRDHHHVLAHPVAESGGVRHLSVARGAARAACSAAASSASTPSSTATTSSTPSTVSSRRASTARRSRVTYGGAARRR